MRDQLSRFSYTVTAVPFDKLPTIVPQGAFLTFNAVFTFTYLVYVSIVTGFVLFSGISPSVA